MTDRKKFNIKKQLMFHDSVHSQSKEGKELMRVLITDGSRHSHEAKETLQQMEISFLEISIDRISSNHLKIPTLLTPEGTFEGVDLVKMYSTAEKNPFCRSNTF